MNKHFLGLSVKYMKPTKKHSPAIWECLLGTVFAMNDKGKVKYFGYDYNKAKHYSLNNKNDLRLWKCKNRNNSYNKPKFGQVVLWVENLELSK